MMRLLFLVFGLVFAVSHTRQFFQEGLFDDPFYDMANAAPAPEQWFDNKIDHFNLADQRTWKQKYYVNDTFWGGAGYPIFLMLGGEGPVGSSCVGGRFIFADWAAQFKALAICIEHRFYGKSIPTADVSTANLKYLSSQQALADYAYFREALTEKLGAQNSKWVAFGGSYSGNLAAWQRIKYPHLFSAALASSAPVMAQEDYPEYFQVVMKSVGPQCAARISAATQQIDRLLDSGASGRRTLESIFGTCDPIATDMDTIQFAESITDPICGVVQYSGDNNAHGAFTIEMMCNLLQQGTDPLAAYARTIQTINNQSSVQCIDASYANMVNDLKNPDPRSPMLSSRSWTYQTCIEYGYFQRTKPGMSPFSSRITLRFFEQICNDVYGSPLIPDVHWTNTYYGSNRPVGTKILYPNGGLDPWHVLGVLSDIGPEQPFTLIPKTAHCADLYASREIDDPVLKAFRTQALASLHKWLA